MPIMNNTQCRLARTALGLTVRSLGSKVGLTANTINRFEKGGTPSMPTVKTLQSFMEGEGVRFTWRTDSDGNIWEGVETLAKEDE